MSRQVGMGFFAATLAIAMNIHSKTGGRMFPQVVLVQMADESDWYTEGCWHGNPEWKGRNNFAGISFGGTITDFANTDEFVDAYVRVIEQNAYGFPHVLEAKTIEDQIVALGLSGWAGSKYDSSKTGRPGVDLLAIYREYAHELDTMVAEWTKENTRPFKLGDRLISYGSTGDDVKQLQLLLHINADGIFGMQTLAAVRQFQSEHGLTVDGLVGAHTVAALTEPKPDAHTAAQVATSATETATEAENAQPTTQPTQTATETSTAATAQPTQEGTTGGNQTPDSKETVTAGSTVTAADNTNGNSQPTAAADTGTTEAKPQPDGAGTETDGQAAAPVGTGSAAGVSTDSQPTNTGTTAGQQTANTSAVTIDGATLLDIVDALYAAAEKIDQARKLLDGVQAVITK